jgi:amidase
MLEAGHDTGPLLGIPVAVKDLCDVRGKIAAAGTIVRRNRSADADACVVERLRHAGAVIVGTTQMTEGAYVAHHPDVAAPRNPWNRQRWSGVSSSGSGVAVAAGLCFGALGTDTGGSIRYPSSVNGSDSPVADYAASLDCGTAGVRIGLDEAFVQRGSQPDIASQVLQCASVLANAGAEIVPVTVPSVDAAMAAWLPLCAADAAIAHADYYPAHADAYGAELASLLEFGHVLSAIDLARAFYAKRDFSGRFAALFTTLDLILCPALGIAVPARAPDWNDLDFVAKFATYTGAFDISGSPTITLPCGFANGGMPIGLQLVGRHFEEQLLCRVAFD